MSPQFVVVFYETIAKTNSIEKAESEGAYIMDLPFSDGVKQLIDFGDFLQNAKNPTTTKYIG